MSETEWLEIKRYDDPLQAEMVSDFLREHDIAIRQRGNAGATSVLNRFSTIVDIRLDVPRDQFAQALETLEALEAGDSSEQPFRGRSPAAAEFQRYVAPKKGTAAMMLGFMVPIGAAHFYAGHGAAGAILFAGVIGSFLGVALGHHELGLAWGILVLADILGARRAVRRHNEGRIPSENQQRLAALCVLGVAFACAVLVPALV